VGSRLKDAVPEPYWLTQAGAPAGHVEPDVNEVLAPRLEVYQAQGMVMVDLGVSLTEAMALLRAHAFTVGRVRFILTDLRSARTRITEPDDVRKTMLGIPQKMWFTFLRLDVPAGDLDYDLAIATLPGKVPSLSDAGVTASKARFISERAGRTCTRMQAELSHRALPDRRTRRLSYAAGVIVDAATRTRERAFGRRSTGPGRPHARQSIFTCRKREVDGLGNLLPWGQRICRKPSGATSPRRRASYVWKTSSTTHTTLVSSSEWWYVKMRRS